MAAPGHHANLLDMCGVNVIATMIMADVCLSNCNVLYSESRRGCLHSCYVNPNCVKFDFIAARNECCIAETSHEIEYEFEAGGAVYSLSTVKRSCRGSGYTFLRTSNMCVRIETDNPTSWQSAEDACRTDGGRLVQLYMMYREGDMMDTLNRSSSKVFHVSDFGNTRLGRTWKNGMTATIQGTCLQVSDDSDSAETECSDWQSFICEIP